MPGVIDSPRDLAPLIEHTALKPEVTPAAIARLCEEAVAFGFRGVCVNPCFVAVARRHLRGAAVRVVSVVGFPLGANLSAIKAAEARAVIDAGADEVDMVLPIGLLLAGEHGAVLDDAQKVAGCQLAERAGAAFVKTSTGFGGAQATVADVTLMRRAVGDRLRVKASGGIRDFAAARALVAAGADVLGCSASVTIVGGNAANPPAP